MTPKLPLQGKEIQPTPVIIYTVLIILAVTSALGLDYINQKKGNKSFIFMASKERRQPESAPSSRLFDRTRTLIKNQGFPSDAFSHYRDEQGFFHIMLKVQKKKYLQLSQSLKTAFEGMDAQVSTESRTSEKEKRYILWRVEGQDADTLYLLFYIQSQISGRTESSSTPSGKVALIIDDLGFSLNSIRTICRLNQKFTIAVLPYSPLARETARMAQQNNLEVILHLPLESLNNNYDNHHTEGLVHSGMSRDEIITSVDEGMTKVPYIRGVNTHMGSKITQNPELMRIILGRIKTNRLYFIDSRTTSASVAFAVARELGIPSSQRHVFLDSEVDFRHIKNQFIKLLKTALNNGYAIGIGHPYPETLKILKENLYLIQDYGLEAVYASEIVE